MTAVLALFTLVLGVFLVRAQLGGRLAQVFVEEGAQINPTAPPWADAPERHHNAGRFPGRFAAIAARQGR